MKKNILIGVAVICAIILISLTFIVSSANSTVKSIDNITNSSGIHIIEDVMEHPTESADSLNTFFQGVKNGIDNAIKKTNK